MSLEWKEMLNRDLEVRFICEVIFNILNKKFMFFGFFYYIVTCKEIREKEDRKWGILSNN